MSRLLALLIGGLCTTTAFAVSPDPKDLAIPPEALLKARELVHRLGSEVYREREDAHAELLKMGRNARPVLLEAVSSDPDPEVRSRCSRLLPRAGAEDLKARLDTFLADTQSKFDHDLPGLKAFRKVVGVGQAGLGSEEKGRQLDEKGRALFVEIMKSHQNMELLRAIDSGPAEGGRAIADRRATLFAQIQHRNVGGTVIMPQQIELPDIACLLFAESLVPSKEVPRTGVWSSITGVTFVQQPASQDTITNASRPHAEVYKRILGIWLETRDDVQDLNQVAYIAGSLLRSLPQSPPLLRRIVKSEGVQGYAKGQALQYLVMYRKQEEVAFLKTLLSDDTLVTQVWFNNVVIRGGQAPQPHQCLVRDVALAFLLHLTGQNLKDYGYLLAPGYNPQTQQFTYGNYAFASEEARSAAMVKFAFWQFKDKLRDPGARPPAPGKEQAPAPKAGNGRGGNPRIAPPPPPA
ncbi:MAG TPA: hypothetical protein VLM40_07210, partial [Gemmata sp.]|nr:hypothetical protein [Gemmata sp.]